jgi:ketosteroid isomerase-like protein
MFMTPRCRCRILVVLTPMHPNTALLARLFAALNQHDHQAMAACYHPAATFHDIAFELRTSQRIHGMWHMICAGSDISATVQSLHADDRKGRASVVDEYTFRDTGRRVRNVIDSRFRFEDGLIIEQTDTCDPRAWARMALGGITGFLAGRVRLLRRWKANRKLQAVLSAHPEYR